MAAPGSPEAMEFFAVDVWMSADDMMGYYEDPDFLAGFDHMFTAEADHRGVACTLQVIGWSGKLTLFTFRQERPRRPLFILF